MPATYININGEQRDASAFPAADRYFRDAWTFGDGAIEIDMVKALALHKDKLRAERAPLLDALDVDSMRAAEAGEDRSAIVAEKQKLRDVTADPRLAAASTPDELKALTLDVLTA